MPTERERRRDQAVALQDKVVNDVLETAKQLDEAAWNGPSNCPPWTVKTILAHITRNADMFSMMLDCGLRGERAFPMTPEEREQQQRDLNSLPTSELANRFKEWHEILRSKLSNLEEDDFEVICPHPRMLQPAWWIVDQRVAELAYHKWDIDTSLGKKAEIAPDVAQFLLPMVVETNLKIWHRPGPGSSGRWVIRATDMADGVWLIEPDASGATITRGQTEGDVTIEGDAASLLLWLHNRASIDDLEQAGRVNVTGQRDRVPTWRDIFASP